MSLAGLPKIRTRPSKLKPPDELFAAIPSESDESGPPAGDSQPQVEFLTADLPEEKRQAMCSVRIGSILIHGIVIFRTRGGRLRVGLPGYKDWTAVWRECIELPPDLRSEVDACVIGAFRAELKKREKQP